MMYWTASMVGGELSSLKGLISWDSSKIIFTSSGYFTKEFPKTSSSTTKSELLYFLLALFSNSFGLVVLSSSSCISISSCKRELIY